MIVLLGMKFERWCKKGPYFRKFLFVIVSNDELSLTEFLDVSI